jgi:hypothetical protein
MSSTDKPKCRAGAGVPVLQAQSVALATPDCPKQQHRFHFYERDLVVGRCRKDASPVLSAHQRRENR